jgi:hypothetical protein
LTASSGVEEDKDVDRDMKLDVHDDDPTTEIMRIDD